MNPRDSLVSAAPVLRLKVLATISGILCVPGIKDGLCECKARTLTEPLLQALWFAFYDRVPRSSG